MRAEAISHYWSLSYQKGGVALLPKGHSNRHRAETSLEMTLRNYAIFASTWPWSFEIGHRIRNALQ